MRNKVISFILAIGALVALSFGGRQAFAYDSAAAVAYAEKWWDGRNPAYYDYSDEGGDCANFVSQCLIAGGLDLSAGPGYFAYAGYLPSIPSCTNLNANLHYHQNTQRQVGGTEPLWVLKGDPIIFCSSDGRYLHSAFGVLGDEYEYWHGNAHTVDCNQKRISWFLSDPNLDYCVYYHIISGTPVLTPEPPTLLSPGTETEPGPEIDTLTPTFQWSSGANATDYGLYIKNLDTGVLVFDSEVHYGPIYESPFTLPESNKLEYNTRYRWNMASHNSLGWSYDLGTGFSERLWFTTYEEVVPPDYPPAVWTPADPSNYTVSARPNTYPIMYVIIHVAEGYYSGTIDWFQDPSSDVSAHYVVKSFNGEITQMVRHKDIAWHAGNWDYKTWSIGIEHEGYINDPSWFTDQMYQSSAALTSYICDFYGIPKTRTYIIGHNEVPGATHTDPGPYWDWDYYMQLVTGTTPLPPTVETRDATPDVIATAATINGVIINNGCADIDERAFDWGTTPSCSDGWTSDVIVNGNSFSYLLTGLEPGTTYYFRAWAHNSAGWGQGSVLSFTLPSVDAFDVTPDSVRLGNSFTISYTVSDDIGLDRVELWRANDSAGSPGVWEEIKRESLSGNGPLTGSFLDGPSLTGIYWYGVHVVNNAGFWSVEPDPIMVEVVPGEVPVDFADPNLKTAVEEALGISDPTPTDMLSLTFLNADSKGIVDLAGLQYATNLTTLLLWGNQISDIWPIAGLTNLTHLFLGDNQIMDISALSGLTNLTYLSLNGNQINDISPLAGLTNLTKLLLGNNQINNISAVSGLTNLTELWLQENRISNISFVSGLTNLTGLYLWENQISNISAVSGLTNLTELFVPDNQVSDISALSSLANLTDLSLYGNQISDISALAGLTNLAFLYLWDNPLNTAAYCTYLPLILANNPGIYLVYDPNPNPLTNDCSTNWTDLAVFVAHWLEPGCGTWNNWCGGADLDHLAGVDLYDFAEFAQYWLAGNE